MVKTEWPNVVAQRGRTRKDGTRPIAYYFRVRKTGAKPVYVRMPDDPKSPEFAAKHRDLSSPTGDKGVAPFSFSALIASYRDSARFRELAARTKQDYLAILDIFGAKLGPLDASRFPRAEVLRMREANSYRPRRANYMISVMAVLMEHAIDLDWRKDNPAKGVKKLRTGEGYQPWTEAQIERFRATADPIARLIFELALGTGQRPGDIVAMRWSDCDGDTIRVKQGKTGRELWVPMTPILRGHLEEAKRAACGLTIIAQQDGRPYTYRGMAQRLRTAQRRAGIEGVSLHGLRKNATIELAEAGCSNAEIKAITGHATDAMVNLYSRGARQRRLAQEARSRAARRNSGDASGDA